MIKFESGAYLIKFSVFFFSLNFAWFSANGLLRELIKSLIGMIPNDLI